MATKGTILKRKISGKDYYYHKYLEDGKQKNEIISEFEAYRLDFEIYFGGNDLDEFLNHKFNLEVHYGNSLFALCSQTRNYKKRFCYEKLEDFINNSYPGRVFILYGLRRTGKTTLMLQSINDYSFKDYAKAVYIKCDKDNTIYQLFDDVEYLIKNGFKYIYIDEVTLLEDFVGLSSTISDIYGLQANVILSGTDSLGFEIASHDELFDRYKMAHTTYISFKEFSYVLGINSIDKYIEYGGTMSKEGVDYNKTINKGNNQLNEYVDSSIIHNIIHSIKNVDNGRYFSNLYDLYEKNELENVINRIIEDSNHRFAISIIEQEFKSHDYGSLKQLLLTPRNYEKFHGVLDGVDEKKLVHDLMDALNIINKEKQTHIIDEAVLTELEYYLKKLDVIDSIKEVSYPSWNEREKIIFTQPGLRYSQAKILVKILLNDPKLKQYDNILLKLLEEKLLSDVKGRMIEEMIIYETSIKYPDTFKMVFATSGEYDMATLNTKNYSADVFEIKYSQTIFEEQYRFLLNEELKAIFERHFYPISNRIVLYRGEDTELDNVEYRNIEDFLNTY